jgi:hypothetical protein
MAASRWRRSREAGLRPSVRRQARDLRFPWFGAEIASSRNARGPAERGRCAQLVAAFELRFAVPLEAAGHLERVARVMRCLLSMKRTLSLSVVVLVASLFVGSALKVHAATTPAAPAAAAVQPADQTSEDGGYWAAWTDAASH